jgi:hypothetical protein
MTEERSFHMQVKIDDGGEDVEEVTRCPHHGSFMT